MFKAVKNTKNWKSSLIYEQATVRDAIQNLDNSKLQIILVVKDGDFLVGTITDGDIRRGLLQGLTLADKVSSITKKDSISIFEGTKVELVNQIMKVNKVQKIPIIDSKSRVVGLYEKDEKDEKDADNRTNENTIVIMAGGFGTRLRPYTENCPKPMLLVHNKPILEHIILNAKSEGFYKFIITIHYLGHIIEEYFKKGDELGVEIEYVIEEIPLGTAGALGLLKKGLLDKDFLVINGDVISDISYIDVLDFHCKNSSVATMAVRQHELKNPYGVVQVDGMDIVGFEEKPIISSNINAGIYVLSPKVMNFIKKNVYCDMPNLFENLRFKNKPIKAYLTHESWMDIGRPDDLKKANLKER